MLQNIPSINQRALASYYRLAIRTGENCLVLGPSGCGKTDIAYQAAEAEGVECIYWNLSVTERPDIQGLPRVSEDGLVAKYAAPERLPFEDTRARIIRNALKCFPTNGANWEVQTHLKELLAELEVVQQAEDLRKAIKYVGPEDYRKQIEEKVLQLEAQVKLLGIHNAMILFDEIDKAPSEVLQPLLELLLSRRINDRPLCLSGCILTGNLPDEHANSEPLSHPITNRNMVFQLEPNFDVWVQWAIPNGVNPLFTGFLSWPENRDLFHKRPSNHEIYCYNFPTPRSWTQASYLDCRLDEHDDLLRGIESIELFRQNLIASKIGVEAAAKLTVWKQHYETLGPTIADAFEGKNPNLNSLNTDQKLVCLIGASARFVAFARQEKDLNLIHERAKLVYTWMRKANMDLRVAALRGTCDANLFTEKGLADLPEIAEIWWEIVKSTRDDAEEEEEADGAEATGPEQPSAP